MSPRVPEYIRTIKPYVAGRPIEEVKREFNICEVIKLASNENPLGPSPKALSAIANASSDLHRYPDSSAFHLKNELSKHLEVPVGSVVVGNGSNELIDMLIRTYCIPGDAIVTSKAAFIAYKLCAQVHGVRTIETPLTPDMRFDLSAMAREVRENEGVKIVFIANPNNPTGTYVTASELESFMREVSQVSTSRNGSVLVALDYAYWEYVSAPDLPDPVKLWRDFKNVVVLRTFSKIHGLAGLRAGYAVAAEEIAATLEKVRQPFNVNSLAMVAAQAALSDDEFVRRSREVNEEGMFFWEKALKEMDVHYWPSQGNFILVDVGPRFGRQGGELAASCQKEGVIFRPVANYGLGSALRISVGTGAENEKAARVLASELKF